MKRALFFDPPQQREPSFRTSARLKAEREDAESDLVFYWQGKTNRIPDQISFVLLTQAEEKFVRNDIPLGRRMS
ncbi:MAG TPA: hypothetical protein VMV79_02895 [Alphaproteobacteria bacterium]|nr:hypothetical protein [Alphaproteobacteria bacterium]